MYFHLNDLIKKKQWLGVVLAFFPTILLTIYIFFMGYDFFSFASVVAYNDSILANREVKKVDLVDGRYISEARDYIKFTESDIEEDGYLFDLVLSSDENNFIITRYKDKIFADTLGYASIVDDCCINIFNKSFHIDGLGTIFTAYKTVEGYEFKFFDGSKVELDRIPNYKESVGVSNLAEFDITDTTLVQVSSLPLDGYYVDLNTNTLVVNIVDDFGLNFLIGSKAPVVLFAGALLTALISWYGRVYELHSLTNKWAVLLNSIAIGVLSLLSIIIFYWTRIS